MARPEPEIVPGMADRIEDRRKERGLSPGQFATVAGLTPEGLMPVRKGYRRRYQDKVKLGVARALQWEPDAIDRLLAGQEPIPLDAPTSAAPPPGEEIHLSASHERKTGDPLGDLAREDPDAYQDLLDQAAWRLARNRERKARGE